MFKNICETGEVLEGFCYINKRGNSEYIKFDGGTVQLLDTGEDSMSVIYIEDIPKLIKALQAAYDYKQEN